MCLQPGGYPFWLKNQNECILMTTSLMTGAGLDDLDKAIFMFTEDGELHSNVTVNLDHPLQSNDMASLDENNLPGIGKWLEKNHLAIHMGVKVNSGFCLYPLYMLLDKHLQQ